MTAARRSFGTAVREALLDLRAAWHMSSDAGMPALRDYPVTRRRAGQHSARELSCRRC